MNRKTFWIILGAFHLLFFAKQLFVQNSLLQDSTEYIYAADNLINKGTLYAWNLNHAFNPDWLTKRPFLYPVILVVFKWLSFGNGFLFFFITYLVQNLISVFNIRLCLKIADRYNPGFSHSKALIFLLLSISQAIYANLVMSEIWLQASMLGIVYILVMHSINSKRLIQISLLLIAGMALKPVLMMGAIILPVVYILVHRKSLHIKNIVIVLVPLLFFIGSSYINSKRTGYFQYSSISTINLLHYNTYVMLMNKYGTEMADSIIDDIKLDTRGMTYAARQEHIESSCKKILKENIGLYTYLHLRGIAFALIDPGRFDFTQFFNLPHRSNLIYQSNQKGMTGTIIRSFFNPLGILLLMLMAFNLYRLFIGIRFIFNRKFDLTLKLAILAFPIYILGLTGPIGTSRFFVPLIPFAFLMFILGLRKKS